MHLEVIQVRGKKQFKGFNNVITTALIQVKDFDDSLEANKDLGTPDSTVVRINFDAPVSGSFTEVESVDNDTVLGWIAADTYKSKFLQDHLAAHKYRKAQQSADDGFELGA